MAWHNTRGISSRTLLSLWLPLPSYYGKQKLSKGWYNVNKFGKKSNNVLHGCTDLQFNSLGH
jgi:hypothetical protein